MKKRKLYYLMLLGPADHLSTLGMRGVCGALHVPTRSVLSSPPFGLDL
jgi:hypothetical protein